ncbi:MAG: hypothetical protein M5U26_18195 [Planctomycetota bacterium]|nr:hypothetical protein [Planctomycetota bacterium]
MEAAPKPMTLEELFQLAGAHPWIVLGVFLAPPLLAGVAGLVHERDALGVSSWRYLYSVLIYVACVPGIFAAVVTGYMLFFRNADLTRVNVLVYFLPIASMVATIFLVNKAVPLQRVPGFDRLSGLMLMLGISFALALMIQRTHIFAFFGAGIETLFTIALVLFGLLKLGGRKLFGEPKEEKPVASEQ